MAEKFNFVGKMLLMMPTGTRNFQLSTFSWHFQKTDKTENALGPLFSFYRNGSYLSRIFNEVVFAWKRHQSSAATAFGAWRRLWWNHNYMESLFFSSSHMCLAMLKCVLSTGRTRLKFSQELPQGINKNRCWNSVCLKKKRINFSSQHFNDVLSPDYHELPKTILADAKVLVEM